MSLITSLNKCPKGLLHDFHVERDGQKVLDLATVKLERCRACGERVRWNKVNGRIDNKKYLEAHRRDFLQREGPTAKLFYAIYQPEEFEENKWKWTIKL